MNTSRVARVRQSPQTPVYLALESIRRCASLRYPELGRLVADSLRDALALPTVQAIEKCDGRRLALSIQIVDVSGGDPLIRASHLLAVLGFGNARFRLRAQVRDLDSEELAMTFVHAARHNGLSRGSKDYMVDNSAVLLKNLCVIAAFRLIQQTHRSLWLSQTKARLLRRFINTTKSNDYVSKKIN